jgi:hypothetical protein
MHHNYLGVVLACLLGVGGVIALVIAAVVTEIQEQRAHFKD